jgi:hypothetical protein
MVSNLFGYMTFKFLVVFEFDIFLKCLDNKQMNAICAINTWYSSFTKIFQNYIKTQSRCLYVSSHGRYLVKLGKYFLTLIKCTIISRFTHSIKKKRKQFPIVARSFSIYFQIEGFFSHLIHLDFLYESMAKFVS